MKKTSLIPTLIAKGVFDETIAGCFVIRGHETMQVMLICNPNGFSVDWGTNCREFDATREWDALVCFVSMTLESKDSYSVDFLRRSLARETKQILTTADAAGELRKSDERCDCRTSNFA